MTTELVSGTISRSDFISLLERRMSDTSIPWIFSCLIALFATGFKDCLAQDVDPMTVSQISLTDVDGRPVEWTDNAEVRVFCFLGVECPVARFYAARLNELAKKYADQKVVFLGINSNQHDSLSDLQKFAKDLGLGFRQIKDANQGIARIFGATRTAEIVVVDRQGHVSYRGRVDDQYAPGVKRLVPTSSDLDSALSSLLSGNPLSSTRTDPVGCLITFEKKPSVSSNVTYCKQVAPILYEHCVDCHRPNEIGPFDVSNYDELRGWSEMIVEVIEQKRMPPWHADEGKIEFKNARHMPAESLELIKRWVNEGTPYGDVKDLPNKPEVQEGWRLPSRPDLVVSMRDRPFTVPATGTVDYQYFVVDPKITEDRWVSAAQVIPGNASVVHHAIVFIRPPDGVESTGVGWLTAFVPGQRATLFPPGYARKVPAGSKLVFQMHYTPNGQEQSDITQIGMNFIHSEQVTHQVFTLVGLDQEFEIPPHASNHEVASSLPWLPPKGELLAIMPHMHLRGKSFRLTATAKPNEANESEVATILNVPHYDFNWQHTYELKTPIQLDAIQKLNFLVGFDNSKNNPFNPNPNDYVLWGDQTWEEMAVAFLEVAKPLEGDQDPERTTKSKAEARTNTSNATHFNEDARATAFAEKLLARFDRNRDGKLSKEESPNIIRDYSFPRLDSNQDGLVTREEMIVALRNSRD